MKSIREIVVPENNKIELTIPDNFIGKRIEVLAFEIEEEIETSDLPKKKTFDAIKLDLSLLHDKYKAKSNRTFIVANAKVESYKFNREEANER